MNDDNPTAPGDSEPIEPDLGNEADPHYVNPDAELDPDVITDAARKNYSLADRLKGAKHRHTRLLVFLDGDSVDAYAAANTEVENLGEQVMIASQAINPTKPDTQAQYDRLLALHNEKEAALEPLRAEMLSNALAIHLKAFPNIAIKVAKREARKKFMPESGVMTPEEQERSQEFMEMRLLGETIAKITDSSGNDLDLPSPREKVAEMLSNELPPSQWARLQQAYLMLVATDQIGTLATDEPGF